jgi:hypothetical protein
MLRALFYLYAPMEWCAERARTGLKNHASLVFFTMAKLRKAVLLLLQLPTPRDKSDARKTNFF